MASSPGGSACWSRAGWYSQAARMGYQEAYCRTLSTVMYRMLGIRAGPPPAVPGRWGNPELGGALWNR